MGTASESGTSNASVLFAMEIPFWREDSGAAVRIASLLRYVHKRGLDPAVFYTERATQDDRARFAASFPGVPLHTPSAALLGLRMVRRRLFPLFGTRRAGGIDVPWTWEKGLAFRSLCRALRPRAVIASYVRLAYLADHLPAGHRPHMILDSIDVMSLRTRRFAQAGLRPVISATEAEESAALARFDTVLAIHDEEAVALRALCPGRRVVTVGHPAPPRPFVFREAEEVRLLFVAAAGTHNRHAIDGFLAEVWPRLRRELGATVSCTVAGRVTDGMDAAPEGVELRGFVDDTDALYAVADIVVNPVPVGSGLKIKNVEALGYGKPVVTTSVGAEGLRAAVGKGLYVADGAAAMATTLRGLCTNPDERRRAAEASHAFAREALGEDIVYGGLMRVLDGL